MKVILLTDVKNYGKKNQIIEVSNGYASNYLLPKKLAVIANNDNLSKLNKQIEDEQILSQNIIDECNDLAKRIADIQLEFSLVFNNNKQQGSISLIQICEVLKKSHNIDIDKRKFLKHDNLKDKGLHYLKIKLSQNIDATLRVNINEK